MATPLRQPPTQRSVATLLLIFAKYHSCKRLSHRWGFHFFYCDIDFLTFNVCYEEKNRFLLFVLYCETPLE